MGGWDTWGGGGRNAQRTTIYRGGQKVERLPCLGFCSCFQLSCFFVKAFFRLATIDKR